MFNITLKQMFALGPLVFLALNGLGPLLQIFTRIDKLYDRLSIPLQNNMEEFDFLIVGVGSTACSLAFKLSEKYSVLVLEYGGTPSLLQYFPLYAFHLDNIPSIDWAFRTVPQKSASFGLTDNTVIWPGGKLLGGSSQLNAMIYVRGNVQGFDGIAEMTGDPRWKMDNILKYYKELESYNGWFDNGDHGKDGPLHVEKPHLAKFTENFLRAGQELGYPLRDPNPYGPYTEGVAPMDLYMKNGRRSDAYVEFIQPILRTRRNLVIRKYSHVQKIIFKPGTTEAMGVKYERHGRVYEARARKEVIISAGTINTAKLLMLSGIGPWEHLQDVGISPLVDLPVGQRLQDKYGALIGPFIVETGKAIRFERDLTLFNFLQWLMFGTGVFKSSLNEGTWAIITNASRKAGRIDAPDIHAYIISAAISKGYANGPKDKFNYKPEVASHLIAGGANDHFFQFVTINRQQGYGFVQLRDKDPSSSPVIDPKYLENEKDLESLVEGITFAVKLVENTKSFQEIDGHLYTKLFPGCESYKFKSHDYFKCLARQLTVTAFKYAGTAPMGRNRTASPDAVVDSRLRVFGTTNLRVIDASILQQKYSSINDATCRMLGLVGSEIVMEDWAEIN